MLAELRWQRAVARTRLARDKERIQMWFTWRLPKRLIYFAIIRAWAHAMTGEYSNVEAPSVTVDQMIRVWNGNETR